MIVDVRVNKPTMQERQTTTNAIEAARANGSLIGTWARMNCKPVGGNLSSVGRSPNHAVFPTENENSTKRKKIMRKIAKLNGDVTSVKKVRTKLGARSRNSIAVTSKMLMPTIAISYFSFIALNHPYPSGRIKFRSTFFYQRAGFILLVIELSRIGSQRL